MPPLAGGERKLKREPKSGTLPTPRASAPWCGRLVCSEAREAARGRMLRLAAAAAARAIAATPAGCVSGLRGALTGQSGSALKSAFGVAGGATAASVRALATQACKAQGACPELARRPCACRSTHRASLRLPRTAGACGRVCGSFGCLPSAVESAAAAAAGAASVAASGWAAAVAAASGGFGEAQTSEEDEQAQEAQADQAGEEQEPRRLSQWPCGATLWQPAWGMRAFLTRIDDFGGRLVTRGLTTASFKSSVCPSSPGGEPASQRLFTVSSGARVPIETGVHGLWSTRLPRAAPR